MSQSNWSIDPTHTEVQFKVKHLVIATVTGTFNSFSGTVESSTDDFDNAKVTFQIDVNSIDTNNADRDAHLKSEEFFSAEKYPTIDFTNGILKKHSGNDYKLNGQISIRGVAKEISLDVEYGGTVVDPWGNTKSGFEINGKLNRKDFGLNWSALTEAGNIVVSDDVKLHINAEFAKA